MMPCPLKVVVAWCRGRALPLWVLGPLVLVAIDATAQTDTCWMHNQMSWAQLPWFGSPEATCTDRLRVSLLPHWGCRYYPDPSANCNNYQTAYPAQNNAVCELPGIAPDGTTRVDSTPLLQFLCNKPVPEDDQTECRNNPVMVGSGIKVHFESDSRAAIGRLQFRRTYRSLFTTGPYGPVSDMGVNWLHESSRRLLGAEIGGTFYQLALRPNGAVDRFKASAVNSPTWLQDYGTQSALRPVLDAGGQITGFVFYPSDDSSVESYDRDGRLTTVTFADGGTLTFDYSTTSTPQSVAPRAGLLIQIRDQFGRQIGLVYSVASGRIAQLIPPGATAGAPAGSGQSPIRYGYDEATSLGSGVPARGQLTSVVWQDGLLRRYHYEDSRFPSALTGITDEANVRFATYSYDADGRAGATELAGGVNRVEYSYADGVTTETDARGAQRAHSVLAANAVKHRAATLQPAGSGSAACSDGLTYDANANVSSRTDFSNRKTCYANDLTRNLETARV
ncbi:MAG: hypothetical protein DPW14_17280, partial [Planctomycetes bacterium]|nr:hypothetical protein [Planctomycetota bacterium]